MEPSVPVRKLIVFVCLLEPCSELSQNMMRNCTPHDHHACLHPGCYLIPDHLVALWPVHASAFLLAEGVELGWGAGIEGSQVGVCHTSV